MKKQFVFVSFLFFTTFLFSQNIVITDDDAYVVNSSAMLDIKSTTKGLLIPRLTTAQRTTLSATAATGLLVFDTDLNSFLYWNGTAWTNLTSGSANGIWSFNSPNVFLTNTANRLGIGTSSPFGKMEVKADASITTNTPIFQVVNNDGDTVFAVYPQGVRINVQDDPGKASGNKGGFAVGGFTPSKGSYTNEYLRVTPDSVRVYIDDEFVGSKASGNKGGFAVGGFSPSKGTLTDNYFFVQDDSTRVYVADPAQGFGVENIAPVNNTRLMKLTQYNYLIGHQSGEKLTGNYNSFFGYQTAPNAINSSNNVLIGYKTGKSLTNSNENVFIGYLAGTNTTSGSRNVFLGSNAGYSETTGSSNVYIGPDAGLNSNAALYNVYIGSSSGYNNVTGYSNTFVGYATGLSNVGGYGNVAFGSNSLLGNVSGYYNSAIGPGAGQNSKGNSNTMLGYRAGYGSATSNYNCNVLLGTFAGMQLTTGSNNVYVGYYTGYSNLTGAGNIFIGTSAGYNETGSNKLYIENSNSSTPLIGGDFSTDRLGINRMPTTYTLEVGGTIWANGATISSGATTWSDERYKKNIQTLESPLDKIMKMRGVTYDWKKSEFPDLNFPEGKQIGVIAQEIEKYYPELVATDENGYKSVSYEKLTPILLEAVKQQQSTIKNQQKLIDGLTEQVKTISDENKLIKAENKKVIKNLQIQINNIHDKMDAKASVE